MVDLIRLLCCCLLTCILICTIITIQVLDCFTTASVLVLSWIFLRVRYQCVHFSGVGICLVGIICLVIADYYGSRYYGAGGTVYLQHFVDFCILIFIAKFSRKVVRESTSDNP